MAAKEMVTEFLGHWGGKEFLRCTGDYGSSYPGIGDWLLEKAKAGITVVKVTDQVVVVGVDRWEVFVEKCGNDYVQTVFELE